MPEIGPHLLSTDGLSAEQVSFILDTAEQFAAVNRRRVKKVPPLRGKTVINLFLEPSTRTRVSFELAAKRLSADAINLSGKDSSTSKGESLVDTVRTIEAMAPDILVLRHASSGAAAFVASELSRTAVINAGDGLHEHPTQALLDALTIRQRLGTLENLTVVFVGDVLRSRVARSNLYLLKTFGCQLRMIAPGTLAQPEFTSLGIEVHHSMESGLKNADVVMSLRMKHEYLKDTFVPSLEEYAAHYCITEELLEAYAPSSIVLAPGPYIRGVEVESAVVDGPRSAYTQQVENGVAVRMAAIFLLSIGSKDIKDPVNYESRE